MPKSRHPDSIRLYIYLSLLIIGTISFAIQFGGAFGSYDYVEYWSAAKAFSEHRNPYNPSTLLEIQRTLDSARSEPLMMWNPPWIFLFLPPLQRSFAASANVFLLFSSVLLLIVNQLSITLATSDNEKISLPEWILYLASFYFPAVMCLALGQAAILVALGATLVCFGFKNQRYLPICLGVALCTLKPHLALLPLICVFIEYVKVRDLKGIAAVVAGLVIPILSIRLISPELLESWLNAMSTSPTGATAPSQWYVATLPGALRATFEPLLGRYGAIFQILLPAIGIGLLLVELLRSRSTVRWRNTLPTLFAFSFLLSPYGWIFDALTLLPFQVISVRCASQATNPRRGIQLGIICALPLIATLAYFAGATMHHQLAWYPLAVVLTGLWVRGGLSQRLAESR